MIQEKIRNYSVGVLPLLISKALRVQHLALAKVRRIDPTLFQARFVTIFERKA